MDFLTLLLVGLFLPPQRIEFKAASPEIIEERLKEYEGNNAQREATLKKLFESVGCKDDNLTEQPVRSAKVPNLICTLPGSEPSLLIVGAHFDKVDIGKGVVDNWSGASLLPSIYFAVKDLPRKPTILFIGFTNEEMGLVGSQYFVEKMPKEARKTVIGMINMDTVGLGPAEVWHSRADKTLESILLQIAGALSIPVFGVNVDKVGSADSESFRNAGIPSLTIHSVSQQTLSILHSPKDRIDAIKMDDYYQTYRLVAAYVAFLSSYVPPSRAASPQ